MHEEAAAMPEKTDEYALLRTEILQNIQTIDNARNILYMAVGAILDLSENASKPQIHIVQATDYCHSETMPFTFISVSVAHDFESFYTPVHVLYQNSQSG